MSESYQERLDRLYLTAVRSDWWPPGTARRTGKDSHVSGEAYTRDLRRHVDKFGNIAVDVTIGGGSGRETRTTGASAAPATIAKFLRELADDVERAGQR